MTNSGHAMSKIKGHSVHQDHAPAERLHLEDCLSFQLWRIGSLGNFNEDLPLIYANER